MRPFVNGIFRWRLLSLAHEGIRRRDRRLRRLRERRQLRALARKQGDPFEDLPDAEFVKTYRLPKRLVKNLIREIRPFISGPRRADGISIKLKVLIALAFYASGSYQTLVGQSAMHNVSQTTVSRAVRQVTMALNSSAIYNKYIRWPNSLEERNRIKTKFYSRFEIPGVLGVIDGTHIAILRPISHEERYFNRKGYHSLNVMIICDSDLNILCVDASTPGSAHDSSVWQSHPLSHHLANLNDAGEQVFLLGDSGYPLRTTMMTPILNTTPGTREHNYYIKHVAARNTVERCIGVLKARFRCLLAARALHYNPSTAGNIVNACCILHNIANRNRAPVTPLTEAEATEERNLQFQIGDQLRVAAGHLLDRHNRRVNPDLQRGRALQQALVHKLWTEQIN